MTYSIMTCWYLFDLLINFCHIWKHLTPLEHFHRFGSIFNYLEVFRYIWNTFDSFGSIYIHLESFTYFWKQFDTNWFIFTYLKYLGMVESVLTHQDEFCHFLTHVDTPRGIVAHVGALLHIWKYFDIFGKCWHIWKQFHTCTFCSIKFMSLLT